MNDSPVLLVNEDGSLTQVTAIDNSIIKAVSAGIMDAVRFHEENFQQYDADLAEWTAIEG